MTTIVNGVAGGALVALVVTAAMALAGGGLSVATTALEATFSGRTAPSRWVWFLAQLLYGGVAGGVLVALDLFVVGVLGVPPTAGEALGLAVGWSGALLLAVLGVRFALRGVPDRRVLRALLAFHLLYGLGLGGWIRLTWLT